MDDRETGQAAGENAPDDGPVTLAEVRAAQRQYKRALERPKEVRDRRDQLIRRALASGTLSQAELARELEISEMQVSRIRLGETSGRAVAARKSAAG